jgi:hypothetical protein
MALLLAVSAWLEDREASGSVAAQPEAAGILASAGWQVVTVSAGTPVSAAWEALSHSRQIQVAVGAPAAGGAR